MSITNEGVKYDGDKLRYDLIPPSTLKALATILTFGANKYSARNWEKGIAWGRVFGALMRHLWAWWGREDTDPETGKSHLWHAQCCLSFLIEYETTHKELDDRPVVVGAVSPVSISRFAAGFTTTEAHEKAFLRDRDDSV